MMLRRTCRETAAILIAREDRKLSLADRVALRLHMTACDNCTSFERQIASMRQAFARWRKGDDDSPG